MRVLLRDAGTGSYFGREMAWVGNPAGAAEFATLEAAGQKAQECGRVRAVVIVRYEKPECELAIDPAFCVTDPAAGRQRLQA